MPQPNANMLRTPKRLNVPRSSVCLRLHADCSPKPSLKHVRGTMTMSALSMLCSPFMDLSRQQPDALWRHSELRGRSLIYSCTTSQDQVPRARYHLLLARG